MTSLDHPPDPNRADRPVLEVAIIDVRAGSDDEFARAYLGARSILAETAGVRSVRMTHGVERPSRFVLLVEWDSIDAHERNFRATEWWVQWRAAIGPFFAEPPLVEHYVDVDQVDVDQVDVDQVDVDQVDGNPVT